MATETALSLDAEDVSAWVSGTANHECLGSIPGEARICGSFVSGAIRLALRAPNVEGTMLAGKQQASLALKDLMAPAPVEWMSRGSVLPYGSSNLRRGQS